MLLSGHHRPPVAKLSPAHGPLCSHPSSSHAHPTPPSRLPGSCCDPTLPLACDLMAPSSGCLSQLHVLWLTFWCGGEAPGLMRMHASVDGLHAPGSLLHPPAKGAGERAPPPRPCRYSGCSPRGERGPASTSWRSLSMQGADEESKSRDGTGRTGQAHGAGTLGRKVLRREGHALAGRWLCVGPDEQEVQAQTETRGAQSTWRLPGIRRPLEFPPGE